MNTVTQSEIVLRLHAEVEGHRVEQQPDGDSAFFRC